MSPKKLIILLLSISIFSFCQGGILKDGSYLELPSIEEDENVIFHIGYTTSYNSNTLIPNWVAYELTSEETLGEHPRENFFCQDPEFEGAQALREDYTRSGYDKGHMAPAADMKWSREAMLESFYLTNICPQNHVLNERDWHALEKKVRSLAIDFGRVYVICGPIIGQNKYGKIGNSGVVVPDAFFKAIMIPYGNSFKAIAFIMDNSSIRQPMRDCALTVDELEEIIHKDLFCSLKDNEESTIESEKDMLVFGIN